jgi:pimeloyl-ACP methyl ester carboxylesterase
MLDRRATSPATPAVVRSITTTPYGAGALDAWSAVAVALVGHASSAQLITVDHASHNIQVDRPDVVVDEVHEQLQ